MQTGEWPSIERATAIIFQARIEIRIALFQGSAWEQKECDLADWC